MLTQTTSASDHHIINWDEATIISRESDRTTRSFIEAVKNCQESQGVMIKQGPHCLWQNKFQDFPKPQKYFPGPYNSPQQRVNIKTNSSYLLYIHCESKKLCHLNHNLRCVANLSLFAAVKNFTNRLRNDKVMAIDRLAQFFSDSQCITA